MRKKRIDATAPIATNYHTAEAAFNSLMVSLGQAQAAIPAARLVPGTHFPLEAGMEAQIELAEAARLFSQGYQRLVRSHRTIGDERSLYIPGRIVADGDIFDTPPRKGQIDDGADDTRRHLHAVGSAN